MQIFIDFITKNFLKRLTVFALILICTHITLVMKCFALPAPLSSEELYQQSDVIAKVKVLGVVKVEEPKATSQHETDKYQAWLKVLQVIKGKIHNNYTIIVTWNRVHKKMIGGWEVNYYPNEELITHLIWDEQNKTYKTLSWNSAEITKPSTNKLLPTDIGKGSFSK